MDKSDDITTSMDENLFCHIATQVFLIFIISLLYSCQLQSEKETRPNIIIILSDDQGWGDLSMNANPYLSTPNIDALAREGAVLEYFYVSPVCSPTRAELLTGRYHPRGGVYSTSQGGERLDLDEVTIAEIFKQNGYKTAAFGKWHNGMQYPYHPNGRGFDEFYGFCSGHWGNYFNPVLEHNGKLVKGKGYLPDDLTEKAMNFMRENKDRPFFLYLPFNTPHSPMQVPDKWWDKFKNKQLTTTHRYSEREDINHTKAAYAMVENIDWNVGRVLASVRSLGLEERTVIVYFSDNGPNGWRWNGDMKGKKGSTDEGGVRSPCIISWKGMIKSSKIHEVTGVIDLLPTLTELAGISYEPRKKLDGVSIVPVLVGQGKKLPERYLVSHWRKSTSVRNKRFRLDDQDRLFDLVSDPGQREDVSDKYPGIHENMKIFKNKWEKEVLSELPEQDLRPFPVGHPAFRYTQLPARDAIPHGNIRRSSRWPNCSFFTNWTGTGDSITWNIEVLESGKFEAVVYYTCSPEDTGSTIELKFGGHMITAIVKEPHDPPLIGAAMDRVPRAESYVKDFKPLKMGVITLEKGGGTLVLKANEIANEKVMDFRLLMLIRAE